MSGMITTSSRRVGADYPAQQMVTMLPNTSPYVLPMNTGTGSRAIASLMHPDYYHQLPNYYKYRYTYMGGKDFVEQYLYQFSRREEVMDFRLRKNAAYCPAIAKGKINNIKNAISQRFYEIVRKGGSSSYITATTGDRHGVDLVGSSMNRYVTKSILPDLLTMGKIGVFIDAPPLPQQATMMDKLGKRPYLYSYRVEDILNVAYDDAYEPNEFKRILLRDNYLLEDKTYGLPVAWKARYRYMWKDEAGVHLRFFNEQSKPINVNNESEDIVYHLDLAYIPFVLFQISESLLTDVADYQIALMNLSSSDLMYCMKSNFPFYTEQFDPISEFGPMKGPAIPTNLAPVDGVLPRLPAQTTNSQTSKEELKLGITAGRRYGKGLERPGYIAPPSEPLLASMEKQGQLKGEINEILNLTLANITAGSVELQEQDRRQGLESGLNNIGVELQHGENRLAVIWNAYEGAKDATIVTYPNTYSLKSDEDRRKEAEDLNKLKSATPSQLFQKEVGKQIVTTLMSGKVNSEKITEMEKQIDEAPTMTSDSEEITKDLENALVSNETASIARGYAKGEAEKAKIDHAERLKRIQDAQTPAAGPGLANPAARGIPEQDPNKKSGQAERKEANDPTKSPVPVDKTRGPGKSKQ